MNALLAETLLATGLVTLAVLILRGPVASLFGARAAYALWLAPLARMAWPLVPDLLPSAPATGGAAWVSVTLVPAAEAVATLPTWLVPAWLGGAAIYLAARLFAHHRFLAAALRQGRPLTRDYPVDLVATPAVDGPLATGLVHRLVLVPDDFETRFTPAQQELALAHEGLHHARGDLWACTAALLLTALNWFNPLAHLALAAFRRDMEAACDAQLLAARVGERPAYAETLLRCAARPVPRSLCALTSIDELKGRLKMLTNTPTTARRLAGTAIAALVAAGGLALSLPAAAQDAAPKGEPVKKQVRIIEIKGADGETKTVKWEGKDGEMKRECPGETIGVEADAAKEADGKKEKAFVLICAKKGETKESAVKGLEDALARIEGNADMDPAIKAQIRAKLQAKIAEMKAS